MRAWQLEKRSKSAMGLAQDLSTPSRLASIGPKSGAGVRKSKRINPLCKNDLQPGVYMSAIHIHAKTPSGPAAFAGLFGMKAFMQTPAASASMPRKAALKAALFGSRRPRENLVSCPALIFLGRLAAAFARRLSGSLPGGIPHALRGMPFSPFPCLSPSPAHARNL